MLERGWQGLFQVRLSGNLFLRPDPLSRFVHPRILGRTTLTRTIDPDGRQISQDIRREEVDGRLLWGRNVWFGSGCVTNARRYYYLTRLAAVQADISDEIGHGKRVA